MTLYRLTWTARPTPYHHERTYKSWHPTLEDVRRAQRATVNSEVEQVAVPTDKAGLLAFLNAESQPQRVER